MDLNVSALSILADFSSVFWNALFLSLIVSFSSASSLTAAGVGVTGSYIEACVEAQCVYISCAA